MGVPMRLRHIRLRDFLSAFNLPQFLVSNLIQWQIQNHPLGAHSYVVCFPCDNSSCNAVEGYDNCERDCYAFPHEPHAVSIQ